MNALARVLLFDAEALPFRERNLARFTFLDPVARERYRVGASSFVEVTQAQSDYAQAETNLIDAIYTYHLSYAALEAAVGRPLR